MKNGIKQSGAVTPRSVVLHFLRGITNGRPPKPTWQSLPENQRDGNS